MSRISVSKVPGFEYPWWATWDGQLKPKVFPTWRDAMECACKQARRREYVLPLPDKDGYITTTDEQTAMEGTEIEHTAKTLVWVEEPGTIGLAIGDCDHYMTTDGAHSIALALAALAEQEVRNESA